MPKLQSIENIVIKHLILENTYEKSIMTAEFTSKLSDVLQLFRNQDVICFKEDKHVLHLVPIRYTIYL